jgi:DNA invertase Pin-like site-specific DNA recombinase
MKYFLYARKSSESEDRQMLSIEAQIEELKEFAKKNKLEIIEIFTESMSAKQPGRPIFELQGSNYRGRRRTKDKIAFLGVILNL